MAVSLYLVIHRGLVACGFNQLDKQEITVGRDAANDIRLHDAKKNVSRFHAIVSLSSSGQWQIRDNSANGTFLDGVRIQSTQPWNVGQEVRIAPYRLNLHSQLSTAIATADLSAGTTHVVGSRSSKVSSHSAEDLLTPAQRRVYEGFRHGLSEKEVAVKLRRSIHTIHSHAKAIYRILSVTSRGELWGRENDLKEND